MDYNEIANRIDELNLDGYKHILKNKWDFPKKLINWLDSNGFSLIGEGFFSSVYGSPSERFVVKINRGRDFDDGYINFTHYCRKNKNNKHLPKTSDIKILNSINGRKFYILFIEKLQPYSEDLFGFGDKFDRTSTIFNLLVNNQYNTEESIISFFNDNVWNINPNNTQMQQIIECVNTLLDIKKNLNINKFDLHNGNIMQRNGVAVITDPVT